MSLTGWVDICDVL